MTNVLTIMYTPVIVRLRSSRGNPETFYKIYKTGLLRFHFVKSRNDGSNRLKKIFLLIFFYFYLAHSSLAYANCDPFTVNCRQSVDALSHYAISSLVLAGTITQNKKIWAILKTPEGNVYAVTTGSRIGQENGQVLQISEDGVTVEEEKNQQKTVVTINLAPVK